MPNSQFHTAISLQRFHRYFTACGNNRQRAEKLYRLNLLLSQKMYAVIGMFEIILRNSIDRHFTATKGLSWLEDAVAPNGYLAISPGCEYSLHSVQEVIQKLGTSYTHDRLITKLTLGFWTHQFSKKEFAAAGSTLLHIFSNRPHGMRQKDVFKILIKINETRNRIAHYEPICFDKANGTISTIPIQQRYQLIVEMLGWLGCTPKRILYGIDSVQKVMQEINSLHLSQETSPQL